MKSKNLKLVVLLLASMMWLNSCGPFKYKPVDAKEFPPEPSKRVKKNIEEGRGFRIMEGIGGGATTYEFASSNPLWRASLDTLDFMPLATANYSGGIIVTDWYSEDNADNESVKISIRFLSNQIRSDALDINIFVKKCDVNDSCVVVPDDSELTASLTNNILRKAASYEAVDKNKNKKEYKGKILTD
jgi:hypothetical protein|tara:strand:- start:508 stop:1068 length:561 start_codon:yes stop_codon:yes gene_type:complete